MKEQDYTEEIKHLESLLVKLKDNHVGISVKPIYLKQTFSFEIHTTVFSNRSYDEASRFCEELGEGWRLPTRMELLLIYQNQKDVAFGKSFTSESNARGTKLTCFPKNYYWSASIYDSYDAWIQSFSSGGQDGLNKDDLCNFIAVRNINH
jgi:hypothetical protein